MNNPLSSTFSHHTGAHVILACHDQDRREATADKVNRVSGNDESIEQSVRTHF